MSKKMMSRKLALAVAASCLAAMSGLVHADNTITFSGEVVATTCDPAVTGGNYTVTLDQVATTKLSAAGRYAALSAPFAIQVVNCPASVAKVGAVLNSSTYDAVTGNLNDMATYGSNAVQIQVMDGTDTTKQVKPGDAAPVTYVTVPAATHAASIPMTAYYYVNDAANVKIGKIKTTAVYALRTQ